MNWGSKSKDFSLLNHMENNHRIIIFIADYYKDRTKKEKKGKHVEVTEFNNFFFSLCYSLCLLQSDF